jgi:hypothetical protein
MHELKVYYRPDNFPDWILWRDFSDRFSMIGRPSALDISGLPSGRAGFAPRISFGKPPDNSDVNSTNRNLRRGYQFQVKFNGAGHMVLDRFRLHAQKQVERSRAR